MGMVHMPIIASRPVPIVNAIGLHDRADVVLDDLTKPMITTRSLERVPDTFFPFV